MLRHAAAALAALLALSICSVRLQADLQAQATQPIDGPALYQQRCAVCHGKTGRGDGEFAGLLDPRPRDFTTGRFKFRLTETGSLPTDDDLAASITNGLHGTAMPSWKKFLTPEQVTALIAQVKTFSPRFSTEQPRAIAMGAEPAATPQSVEAGRAVYDKLKCGACHGSDGRGTGAIAQELKDDWGRATRATNLDEPWAFRGGNDVRDIYLRFRTGMNGTPMPSFLGAATEPELWRLAVYVKSLGRKPLWEMKGDEITAYYREQEASAQKDLVRHGEYIAQISLCAFCHSPFREDNTMIDEFKYAGGQRFDVNPFGTFVSYNLTSDKETGLGGWTDDQIKTFVTSGVRRDGSRMLPFPMPWTNFANMKPQDLNALVAFLRSLPPVSNRIPVPRAPNLVSYLSGKFSMLILHRDPPQPTYPGNAGDGRRCAMKRFLKWFGLVALVLGVVGFLAFLYFIPPFMFMKPEEFSGPAGKAGPDLSKVADPGERAIAERGHYLVTLGSCADCHSTPTAQGPDIEHMYLAGGARLVRKGFGTYTTINLTPDKQTGVGNWSDEDLTRVWRNGLAPDGRQIPGHLMPWPGFSHWTDEDLHAVIVYLRHTAPISHAIPAPTTAEPALSSPGSFEEDYFGADYGAPKK